MKKIFSFSILAATAAVLMTACQPKNDVDEPQGETINSKVVMRSSNTNSNQWEIIPDWPTQAEKDKVLAAIGAMQNPTSVEWPKGCTQYIVQDLVGAHHQIYYTDFNGAKHGPEDATAKFETLSILEDNGQWCHVNGFNAGKGNNDATHNCAMMDNGFNGAMAINEYSGHALYDVWCLFLIDGQYYLGLDFYMDKDGHRYVDPDGIYDDWIVKIIPLNGEKPEPEPDPEPDPDPDPVDPDEEFYKTPNVEFDIHQQEHKDWKEIKTSIHLRDTVDFTVLLPIPEAYQAPSDDFAIRGGEMYEYIAQEIKIADKTFEMIFEITHKAEGIEIFVKGSTMTTALRAARAIFKDGLTFEVHTYVKNEVDGVKVEDSLVWDLLKSTEWPVCTIDGAPASTHLRGQITSAFWPEDGKYYDSEEQEN